MLWFLGGLLLLVVLLALMFSARSAWRGAVRQELIAVLREKHTGLELVSESEAALELRLADGTTGTLNLGNLYATLASAPNTEGARRELVTRFVESVLAQQREADQPLSLETHGDRLMPRLAPESLLAESDRIALVYRPSGLPGLLTTYVLDSEASVMYLTESHLRGLGLDAAALHERALANLRRVFPATVVRGAVETRQITLMKAGDSFDATRLLLVPEALGDGEELVALIPDRETLALAPLPADDDWGSLRKLARSPASPYHLLDRPVRVTRDGFRVV